MSSFSAATTFRTTWRRFRRNRRGSAAVEFALVAPVFFALLFAIIETAIVFFASQVLETVTQDSARMIMTGQAQTAAYTPAQFKANICGRIVALFDCTNGIYVDVQSYTAFGTVTSPTRSTAPPRTSLHRITTIPATPAISWLCGCSINGRCSSPASVTTSPIWPAASAC